jgi:hypothetical protein
MGMGIVPILISIPKNLTFLGMDMRNLTQNTQYSMGIQIYFYLKLMKMTWNLFINSIFNYFYITYLKILKPIYLLNIHLQRDNSSIGEVIPAILNIINKLEIIKLTPKLSSSCNSLCELLREEIKTRFNYELNTK